MLLAVMRGEINEASILSPNTLTVCATPQLPSLYPRGVAKDRERTIGHASVAFTLDVYSHVLPHMQDAAAMKVEALLMDA